MAAEPIKVIRLSCKSTQGRIGTALELLNGRIKRKQSRFDSDNVHCPTKYWAYHNMNQTQFVTDVYEIAWQSKPDLDSGSTFQEILEELKSMKDKSMRWDILCSSFKGEVERPTLRDTQAARQGQL